MYEKMSFGNPVQVNQVSTGTGQEVRVSDRIGAIVGYGSGSGDYGDNVAVQLTNLSTISDEYGADSAIYKAAYLISLNAGGLGQGLWIVQHASSAGAGDTQDGDGNTKEFTIAGVVTQVLRGSLTVTVGTLQTEGTDYIVDYSNGIVYFNEAPPTGTDNVVFAWREATTTHIDNALAELEKIDLNFVCLAYVFDATLLARLTTHVTNTESEDYLRMGFMSGKHDEYTDILALATANDYKRIAIFANRSGWKGTSNQNWLEFRDPAAIAIGLGMRTIAGDSFHYKDVFGYNLNGQFTSVQIGNYTNLTGMLGKGINIFFDPRWKPGTGVSVWGGYTNDQNRLVPYIDKQRAYDYGDHRIKAALAGSSAIFGTMKVARASDVEAVATTIFNVLTELERKGMINPPNELPAKFEGLVPIDWELLYIMRKAPEDRTSYENTLIITSEAARHSDLNVNCDYLDALHTLSINLAML